ncbi:hypothetical protein I6F15_03500 [Bradyrhizobium sp. BRP14]|nr:hypothetical protein [Bradyrhizobium sp. BRP14]
MREIAKFPDIETAIKNWRYGIVYRRSRLGFLRILPWRRMWGLPFEQRHERLLRKWLAEQGFTNIDDKELRRALLRASYVMPRGPKNGR